MYSLVDLKVSKFKALICISETLEPPTMIRHETSFIIYKSHVAQKYA